VFAKPDINGNFNPNDFQYTDISQCIEECLGEDVIYVTE